MRLAWRKPGSMVVAAGLVLSSCGSDPVVSTAGRDASGDGRLDCAEGEITQGAEIEVFADSELEVVALALERWTAQGASVVGLPPDESWAAVLDSQDVAIAYPETNGDGRWTVQAVSTCGPPQVGPAPVDGNLDCSNDAGWGQQGLINGSIPGFPTPEGALRAALAPYLRRHDGEIVMIGDEVASIVLSDREQVVASATEVRAGGWVVATITGCVDYR